jgi:hypothetical protein
LLKKQQLLVSNMASNCAESLLFPLSFQHMVRQAIRLVYGREQSRRTHHPEHGRGATYLPE